MQKLKEYMAIRAVRLGLMAVLVATFVGLPSLKYYTGTQAFAKLDVIDLAASVFLAEEMHDDGMMPPPPPAGGDMMMPPPPEPPQNHDNEMSPPPPPVGDSASYAQGNDPASFRGDRAGCESNSFFWDDAAQDCFPAGNTHMPPMDDGQNNYVDMGNQDSSCMWRDDNNSCVADGIWEYTTSYGNGGQWCRAVGTAWECQSTDPSGSASTTGDTTSVPQTESNENNASATSNNTSAEEHSNLEYVETSTQPVRAGAVDDLKISDVDLELGSNKVTVNVCSASTSQNNIGYYIVRVEVAGNPRVGGTQYVQDNTLNPGDCADIIVSLNGLKNINPGQPNGLEARLRNDDANIRDMDRSNDSVWLDNICFDDGKIAECPAGSDQFMGTMGGLNEYGDMGPMMNGMHGAAGDMGETHGAGMDAGEFDDMRPMEPRDGMFYGAPDDMRPNHFEQFDFSDEFRFDDEYKDFGDHRFGDFKYNFEEGFEEISDHQLGFKSRELSQRLSEKKYISQDFTHMAFRIEDTIRRFEEMNRMDKHEMERFPDAKDELGNAIAARQGLITLVKEQIAELQAVQNLFSDDYDALSRQIDAVETSDDFHTAEVDIQKLDAYQALREGMDQRVQIIERDMAVDIKARVAQVRGDYSRNGVEIPSELASKLKKLVQEADVIIGFRDKAKSVYNNLKSEVSRIRGLTDPEAIRSAVDDVLGPDPFRGNFNGPMMGDPMNMGMGGDHFNGPMMGGDPFGGFNGPMGGDKFGGGFEFDAGPDYGPMPMPDPSQICMHVRNKDVKNLCEDFQEASMEFEASQPWRVLDLANQGAHQLKFRDGMLKELEMIKSEIGDARDALREIEGLNIDHPKVVKALKDLRALAGRDGGDRGRGLEVMEKMQAYAQSGKLDENPQAMEALWETMEKIGMTFDRSLNFLQQYFEANKQEAGQLSESTREFLYDMGPEGPGGHGGPAGPDFSEYEKYGVHEFKQKDFNKFNNSGHYNNVDEFNNSREKFYGAYGDEFLGNDEVGFDMDEFVAQIRAEVMEEVTRKVRAEFILAAAELGIEDKIYQKMSTAMFNITDKLGDAGVKAIEKTTEVVAAVNKIDMATLETTLSKETPALKDELAELKKLHEKTRGTVIAESTADEIGDKWEEIRVELAAEPDEKALQIHIEELKTLFNVDNEDALFREGIKAKDYNIDDWFAGDVAAGFQGGLWSGKKDADGNLTGNYDPSANVTYAEALKMSLESAGHGAGSGVPEDSRARDGWYAGYVDKAEELGLDDTLRGAGITVQDWNAPIPRGDMAVLLGGVHELEGYVYQEGTFPDVDRNDPRAGYMQAMNEFGVFTGVGGPGGNMDPNGLITRAATAKTIITAQENAGSLDVDQLDAVSEALGDFEVTTTEVVAPEVTEPTTTVQRKISFVDFLKAMIPLLW